MLFIACLGGLALGGDAGSSCGQNSQAGSGGVREPGGRKDVGTESGTSTLDWVKEVGEYLEQEVADYSATLFSRERVDGKLGEHEIVAIKVRHRPFSVYACVLSPASRKGNEAIYVEGQNGGRLLVHAPGGLASLFGTISLEPNSPMALMGRRHPITEVGMLNLCRGTIEFAESGMQQPGRQVRVIRNAKVNGRLCSVLEIRQPVPLPELKFHLLRLFVDDELRIPIRYEQHDWPKEAGGPSLLVEEYTYTNVKLNNGFTDQDFDPQNPKYGFP